MRSLLVDWKGEAQQAIGQFRAANGARSNHPRVRELVDGLTENSSDFARMWAEHHIRGFASSRKHFQHPVVGDLAFDYAKLASVEDSDQHLLTFMPADRETADRLPRLLSSGTSHSSMATPG